MDIKSLSAHALISLQTQAMDELASRRVVQNPTQPAGDYATYLACEAFGLKREPTSTSGYDASDSEGLRYQVKFKRLMDASDKRQLNAIKGLEQRKFDFLIGVLFNADMSLYRAALLPFDIVTRKVDQTKILLLSNKLWDMDGVIDITDKLKAVQV